MEHLPFSSGGSQGLSSSRICSASSARSSPTVSAVSAIADLRRAMVSCMQEGPNPLSHSQMEYRPPPAHLSGDSFCFPPK